ncbi:unnamed protein product [Phytophthora fragariaefolia]|uniref:Unnamed protein product n=1 Tax=Phytophthora fragariaefolia TaxID=1490495 RepID=A0A9W6YAF3_9STRA|nr:unnamed protein product [Phytophthora fragariaefolia]
MVEGDKKLVELTRRQQNMEAGTKTVSPAPDWLPLGVRIEAKRERTSGSSQGSTRCQVIFTATGCGLRGDQCDVDTAFRYGKREEEIYMEVPEGLRELLEWAEAEGDDDVVFMLLQILYRLKQTSRVWNETIDKHLMPMVFKPADADPYAYTRGNGDEECIVCLYVDDMLIESKDKTMIALVKAELPRILRSRTLDERASFSKMRSITTWNERRSLSANKLTLRRLSRGLAKKMQSRAHHL